MSIAKPKIPNFTIAEMCGRGGIGVVWMGIDADGIKRAIRTMEISALPPEQIEREAGAIALFRNIANQQKNLLDILYIGKTSRYFYYVTPLADNVMEYSRRYTPDTLAWRVSHRHITRDELFGYMEAIVDGVAYLHSRNVAHRDLKPDNIIFVDKTLKIADPGLASDLNVISRSGTRGYLPPWPDASGTEIDIYAIGKILYCLFTGSDADEFPVIPASINSRKYAKLNAIALRCCSPDSSERFAHVNDIREALARAKAPTGWRLWCCWLKRKLTLFLALALLVSVGLNLAPYWPFFRYHMSEANARMVFKKIQKDFGVSDIQSCYALAEQLVDFCPKMLKDREFCKFYKQVKDNYEWITFQSIPDHAIQSFPITANLVIPVPLKDRIQGFYNYFRFSEHKAMYPTMLFEFYVFLRRTGRIDQAREMREMLAKLSPQECNVVALSFACMKMSNFMAHDNRLQEALFFAEKARDASPNIPTTYVLLFQANYLSGNRAAAMENLMELRRLKPASIFIGYCLDLLNDERGDILRVSTEMGPYLGEDSLSIWDSYINKGGSGTADMELTGQPVATGSDGK